MLKDVLENLDDEDIFVDENITSPLPESNKKVSKLPDDYKCPICGDLGIN